MALVGRKHGKGADEIIAAAQEFLGPVGAARREAEIAALPTVVWKGRLLYTLQCQGVSGRGPHAYNVPLAYVWHLIGLDHFYCPYHAGDAWAADRIHPDPGLEDQWPS